MVSRKGTISEFREASISEFFEKNRHILGFDSPQKSLFMIVKEAMDNSLDACEEYQILPEITVSITKIGDDEYSIMVEDNGPGIERKHVPDVFGRLLYGSRFHSLKQSRGQQGIGITAAILYGQITTASPTYIKTKRESDDVAYEFELGLDVKHNVADLHYERPVIWNVSHGTHVAIKAKGKYQTGKQSIFEYIKESAVANPNATFHFTDPDGKRYDILRVVDIPSLPAIPVKPHPLGLEVGEIMIIAKSSEAPNMKSFLKMEFNRISDNVADEILEKSGLDKSKDPKQLSLPEIKLLKETFSKVKLMPPPTDCLSGLGSEFIRKGLKSVYGENKPSHYSKPISRPVSIYNGNPFSVEAGLVFGGNLRADEPIRIVRFANKVPLLYQPGACVITKSISEMDWRPYGFDQKGGTGIPFGPAIVFVHVYGIRMPFTSESKEAIASVPEISNEISAALKMLGRGVKLFLGKKDRRQKVYEKFRLVSALLPEIGRKSASILGKPSPELDPVISKIANVVFVTEEINKQGEVFNIRVRAINYTKNKISMKLFADPATGDDIPQNLQWEIDALEPSKEFSAQFSIPAVQDYQGTNYYFTGIDPVRVQGAEPLPADFGTGSVEVMETEDEENVTK